MKNLPPDNRVTAARFSVSDYDDNVHAASTTFLAAFFFISLLLLGGGGGGHGERKMSSAG
jgi:hypothetical protein